MWRTKRIHIELKEEEEEEEEEEFREREEALKKRKNYGYGSKSWKLKEVSHFFQLHSVVDHRHVMRASTSCCHVFHLEIM
jgi:hypothetical protein